jgi:hypothetical protein
MIRGVIEVGVLFHRIDVFICEFLFGDVCFVCLSFITKQDFEISALLKRIQSGRDEQMRNRQAEWERYVVVFLLWLLCVWLCCFPLSAMCVHP